MKREKIKEKLKDEEESDGRKKFHPFSKLSDLNPEWILKSDNFFFISDFE